MTLRICVLGSGSSGNCTYVASAQTAVLVDAGLSCREIGRRLESVGVGLAEVKAVCVTHEHDDHTASLGVLHRRFGVTLYANSATASAIEQGGKVKSVSWNVFTTGYSFDVGDLKIDAFSVPHDSYDPVGFLVSCGDVRVGIVTDMGMVTGLIRERLKKCNAVVIEANHDEQLLKDAARPWSLKQRIAGRQGHLSNSQAGELITDIAWPELKTILLAHLSSECNTPELAMKAAQDAVQKAGHSGTTSVTLTYANKPSEMVVI
jgi:phosphoribosyl 1,2-cyclic phosphodiesterase